IIISTSLSFFFFFFNDTATTEIYTLSLHDALPISIGSGCTPPPITSTLPTRWSPNVALPSEHTDPTACDPNSPATRRPSASAITRTSTRRTPSTNHTAPGTSGGSADSASDQSSRSTNGLAWADDSSSTAAWNPMPKSGIHGSARSFSIGRSLPRPADTTRERPDQSRMSTLRQVRPPSSVAKSTPRPSFDPASHPCVASANPIAAQG